MFTLNLFVSELCLIHEQSTIELTARIFRATIQRTIEVIYRLIYDGKFFNSPRNSPTTSQRKIDDKDQRTQLDGRLIFNVQQENSELDMKIKINSLMIQNTHNVQMQTNQTLIEIHLDPCLC